ncbi:MAG: hypothetical protein PVI86_08035 [Phycisphaerae bacterium]|jgi:hypothetical protein
MPRKQRKPPTPPPRFEHGPASPPVRLFGPDRLRKVLGLSTDVDLTRLCDDAATEIETLREAGSKPRRDPLDRD